MSGCPYCGREAQTLTHHECDGCGCPKRITWTEIPHDLGLGVSFAMRTVYGVQMLRPGFMCRVVA